MSVVIRASDMRFVSRVARIADRVRALQEPSIQRPESFTPRSNAWGYLVEARLDLSLIIERMTRDHREIHYAQYAWELLDLAAVVLSRSTPEGMGYVSRDIAAELIDRCVGVLRNEKAE